MKIGVSHITQAHFSTLKDQRTGRISYGDIIIFFILPLVIGFLSLFSQLQIGKEFYNISITFFGIFIALLLNIQVAIFGIYQRDWSKPESKIDRSILMDKLEQKKDLLRELNINVSYLVTLSCFALIVFVVLFAFDIKVLPSIMLTSIIYSHFMLTLLMVVKRTYALFQAEYDIAP